MKKLLKNKNTRSNLITYLVVTVFFLVLIIVLLVRPAGLLGKRVQEKV